MIAIKKKMNIILRNETENDYNTIDFITREAFWNLHYPGCDEHLLIHNMRKTKEYIRDLAFVALIDEKIVGNIAYMRAKVDNHIILTFGPISVLPEYQNKGIGSKLINHTINLAKEMGERAIIIYGDPDYYARFGFIPSKHFQITDKEYKYPAALLVLELYPHALKDVKGIFDEGVAYKVDQNELIEFDKLFPPKEKGYQKTQDRFNELSNTYL